MEKENKYKDILDYNYQGVRTKPRSSLNERAEQFAGFEALTGYDDMVDDAGIITYEKIDLSTDQISVLNARFKYLFDKVENDDKYVITYFKRVGEEGKGFYKTIIECVKTINDYDHTLILENGNTIQLSDIYSIESDEFDKLGL